MTLQIKFNGIESSKSVEEELPDFAKVQPDFNLEEINKDFEKLIVIGNGGSITSLRAHYYAFLEEADKELEIISTMDPDRLHEVHKHAEPENTLVMPISKSGSTIGVIESLMFFINKGYNFNPLTTPGSPLHKIAEKYDRKILKHQGVGGRFSGLTNTGLAPAELLGIDSSRLREGGEEAYQNLSSKAAKTASALHKAEQKGFNEVLTPFYSSRMFGFYPLLVQLMHETVCKQGKGQTFYGDHAPEYQHHTNQRLFGGQKNVLPFFFRTTQRKQKIQIPSKLTGIQIKNKKIEDFNGENLSEALKAEYSGIRKALEDEKMPFIDLKLENSGYKAFGKLMAFMQMTAYYSAKIRDVDPLTQPNVEKSKKMGIEERFK
jgi:glucose-6-phosphate isomerase